MSWIGRLLGGGDSKQNSADQAVIITLDGQSLPDKVYEDCDTSTLEDLITEAVGDLGECDGTEHGPTASRVFVYGRDAEAMFRAIEPTLRQYPLASRARVVLRQGAPGASEREVQIP